MNFKTTYILFGTLAVFLGVLGIVLWFNPVPGDLSVWVLPSLHNLADPANKNDVVEVTIERNRPKEEKWVFVKKNERWIITEPREMSPISRPSTP